MVHLIECNRAYGYMTLRRVNESPTLVELRIRLEPIYSNVPSTGKMTLRSSSPGLIISRLRSSKNVMANEVN